MTPENPGQLAGQVQQSPGYSSPGQINPYAAAAGRVGAQQRQVGQQPLYQQSY
jgi:hypothetical protein